MIIGLLGCLVVLFAQLAFLHYVDLRVAAMPRLVEPPADDDTPLSIDTSDTRAIDTREETREAA